MITITITVNKSDRQFICKNPNLSKEMGIKHHTAKKMLSNR